MLIWLPIVGGFVVLGLRQARAARRAGCRCWCRSPRLFSEHPALHRISRPARRRCSSSSAALDPAIHAQFYIGVDGISMPLILLTTFTTVLIVIAGWTNVEKRPAQYFAAFLILEGLMIGVFAALDARAVLRVLGGDADPDVHHHRRLGRPAARVRHHQVLPVHVLGSLLMLVALIYLYLKSGSYDLARVPAHAADPAEQTFIFLAFFAAFAVKVPMWPVHTWLPDAHVEAPTGGSVVLAAIMLKMGGYGFLRFSLPIAPDASRELDWLMIALSLIAVVYIGFVALVQQDMKKLIAYSSIAHMGFVTLGAFIGFRSSPHTGRTTGIEMGLDGADRADDFARPGLGRDVPVRRRHVRPHAQPRDQRLRRRDQHHAEVRRVHGAVRAGQFRPAGNLRLRRRVPGHPGGVQGQRLVRLSRGHHAGARRGLYPVAGQARDLRSRGQRQGGALEDLERPRVPGARRAGGAVLLVGVWPAPLLEVMRANDAASGPAIAGLEDRSLRVIA
jgi:hypothetical protein